MEKTSAIPKEMDAEGREYVILHTKLLFNNIEPCKIVINKKRKIIAICRNKVYFCSNIQIILRRLSLYCLHIHYNKRNNRITQLIIK